MVSGLTHDYPTINLDQPRNKRPEPFRSLTWLQLTGAVLILSAALANKFGLSPTALWRGFVRNGTTQDG